MTTGNYWLALGGVGLVCGALGFAAGLQVQSNRSADTAVPAASMPAVPAGRGATPEQAPAPAGIAASDKPAERPAAKPPEPDNPPVLPAEPPAQEPDPWHVNEDTSEMDDSPRVTLIAKADDYTNRFGMRSQPALIIRCQEKSTDLYIVVDEYLGMETISVTSRTDDDKASTSTWGISTDSKAMFARGAIAMAKKLTTKNSLTVRFTPYNESPVTLKFNVSRLEEHLPRVAAACGWKP